MKIQIDSAALAALFPEGSQARVELQNAVIAQFCRTHIKPALMGAEALMVLKDTAAQVAKDSLREMGLLCVKRYGGAEYSMSDGAKKALRDAAKGAFLDIQADVFHQVREEAVAAVLERMNTRLEAMVEDAVIAAVRKHISDRVTEALRTR